jgi:hypothetical protein
MSSLITIQEGYYTYDVNGINGRFFPVNNQFHSSGMEILPVKCCGSVNVFVVDFNGTTYYIPVSKACATTIPIPKEDQSFNHVLYTEFLQNNCINCNGLKPHGDYSNYGETPGYKDPDLVSPAGQNEEY